ncbi:acyltransferase [Thalassotalea sp. PP2-459]|uniref:acyltransferase family protein n=1 Tax=Thalassotalea sp. PP2-459 TaxID=1742724 RepID=UPI000942EA43|nr:acyltransferase [Thalassotalea sp. PP2-459]OKY26637.1 acyltransferase [Thalassotalea sp. PP2-459]
MDVNPRFYEIDLYRFLAAIGVVIFHYTYTAFMEGYAPIANFPELREVTRYFYMGINFFFVISGFVIFMSVADGSVRKFLISRFVRLYPAYWAALIMTSIATVYFGGEVFSINWPQFWANVTMINETMDYKPIDGAYWTLYIELKFYLFMLFILATGVMKYFQSIIALVLVGSTVVLFFPWAVNINMFTAMFPHWSGYFAAGCIFYLIRRDGINFYRTLLLALAYFYIIKQSTLFGGLMGQWFSITFDLEVIVWINSAFFALLMVTALVKENPLRKAWCYYLGVFTYPIYLVHQHIGYMAFNYFGTENNITWLVVLTVLVMAILAWLVHQLVEVEIGKRLSVILKRKWLTNTDKAVDCQTG